MKIVVDADACPSINLITNIAKENDLKLILYTDTSRNLTNDYADIIVMSKGYQSVDMAIINNIDNEDILITQDFGLAELALARGVYPINPKGMIYTNDNIERLLFERHLNAKNRRQGIHTKGPSKRTKEDDEKLIESINLIIKK